MVIGQEKPAIMGTEKYIPVYRVFPGFMD
jgi:hypothetical protein